MVRIAFFMLLSLTSLRAQTGDDLFDEAHSRRFAQYLLASRQYSYAAMELERLLTMSDQPDPWVKSQLWLAYRNSGQEETALQKALRWQNEGFLNEPEVANEYGKTLAQTRRFADLRAFLGAGNGLDSLDRERFLSGLRQLESEDLPRRSPFLAGALSTLVPGSGKVYAGRWKDGAFSFAIIGAMSWRAYRGFQRKGIKSELGWGFGLVAAAYYAGNIWGSAQAAKIFNRKKRDELENRVVPAMLGGR
jgi:hypothetical protein